MKWSAITSKSHSALTSLVLLGPRSIRLTKVVWKCAHPRGKPGFFTYESGLGRETDSPLEEAVRSEPVSDVTPSGDGVLAIPFQDNSKP
jgi:hypothetical protein